MSETRTRRQSSMDTDRRHGNSVKERMRGNGRRQNSTKSLFCQGRQSSNDTSGYESMDAVHCSLPKSPPPSYESLATPEFVAIPDESPKSRRSSHRSCRSYHNLPVREVNYPEIEEWSEMTLRQTTRNGTWNNNPPDVIVKQSTKTKKIETKKVVMSGQLIDYEILPVTSPVDAKALLVDFCGEKISRSAKFAKKCHIDDITQEVAFRCQISSYTESRNVVNKSVQYKGEKLDKSKGKVSPWDIPVRRPEFFQNKEIVIKIPHTEELKSCHKCKGKGHCDCSRCHGTRSVPCYRCHGTGTIHSMHGKRNNESCGQCYGGHTTCGYCRGNGEEVCATCDGNKRLKHYKQLEVTWNTVIDRRADKVDGVPEKKIMKQDGKEVYFDIAERLEPIKEEDCLHKNVRRFSKETLEKHYWPTKKILQQECYVDLIPVNVVTCVHKSTRFQFYIIGVNEKVYAPNYPGSGFGIASLFR